MHILIDTRPFFSEHFQKEKLYCEDFFCALFRNFPSDIFYLWTTGTKRKKNIFSFPLEKFPNVKQVHNYISEKKLEFMMKNFSYPKADDIAETEAMKKGLLPWIGKFDATIFFAPYTTPVEESCLKIAFVNDFSEYHFPQYFPSESQKLYTKSRYKSELRSSDGIITPSEFVKNDIQKSFGIDPEKIFPLGIGILEDEEDPFLSSHQKKSFSHTQKDISSQDTKENSPLDTLPENFFFVRGVFSELKNIHTLLKAYSLFYSRFGEQNAWKLVIEEEHSGDLESIHHSSPDEKMPHITVLPPLSTDDRKKVLKQAKAFIYPSLYDGVGKPVLEAMRQGCPILASHYGALPEIYGECALSFDPTQYREILKIMKKFFSNPDLQKKTKDEAKEQSFNPQFRWDDIAEKCMQYLQEKREDKNEALELS